MTMAPKAWTSEFYKPEDVYKYMVKGMPHIDHPKKYMRVVSSARTTELVLPR